MRWGLQTLRASSRRLASTSLLIVWTAHNSWDCFNFLLQVVHKSAQKCRSLRQILEYSGPDSVKDTFCQVFAIDGQVAGEHYTVELVPGGADIDVTEENRREFVDKYVDYVLNKSIEGQYAAFFEGLMMLCKGPAITLFSPVEMERLVCGNPHLDFKALESAAKYEAGFTVTTPAIIWLWDIAQNEFDLPAKKMFLKFFTGAKTYNPISSTCIWSCARGLVIRLQKIAGMYRI